MPEPADRLVVTLSDDWLRDVTTEVRRQAVTAMLLERARARRARTGRWTRRAVAGEGSCSSKVQRASARRAFSAPPATWRRRPASRNSGLGRASSNMTSPTAVSASSSSRSSPRRPQLSVSACSAERPAVRPLLAAGAASPQSPAADTSYAVLHGVYWLVNNLAEDGPVVALVDDVQWSDAESMRFFNYLAAAGRASRRRHRVDKGSRGWPTPIWPGWPAVPRRRSCVPAR